MIKVLAVMNDQRIVRLSSLADFDRSHVSWFWVDFCSPSSEESKLLEDVFHFHPLAIEDCLFYLQRPKMDHYDDVHFLVLHAMNESTMETIEVDLFLGPNYLVSYHLKP